MQFIEKRLQTRRVLFRSVAKKLTGILNYSEPKTSIANYTSNQHTADYHRA